MRLPALLAAAGISSNGPNSSAPIADVDVSDVVSDSRKVRTHAVFVAIDGARSRGSDHAVQAVADGACYVISGRPLAADLPHCVVADPRSVLGALASALYGHPSHDLAVVAVTGTNGKSTVCHLVAKLLRACGREAASIGTLGIVTAAGTSPGALTSPECADMHRILAQLRDGGCTHVAVEASSHALDQRRLAGVRLAAAAWTNLSHDHLDYHGDLDAYAGAKARLFRDLLAGAPGFVNGDDPYARQVADLPNVTMWSRGDNADAEHQLAGVRSGHDGTSLVLHSRENAPLSLTAQLLGSFNADNVTAAVLIGRSLGLTDDEIATAAPSLSNPPGRMQAVPTDIGSAILVDYAHTPDALERSLAESRLLCAPGGRLVCVFGCGGDRDRSKRTPMGEIAGRGADLTIATSDNPRSEDPDQILDAVCEGLRRGGSFELDRLAPSRLAALGEHRGFIREADRGMAIRRGIGILQPGDVLLIAGKGHENTQTIGDKRLPFDDAEIAAGWLQRHRRTGAGLSFGGAANRPTSFAFTGADALRACGGSLLIDGRASTSMTTDSRAVLDDCVFVALSGDRFDGNKFVAESIDSGAAGVVCATGRGQAHVEIARAAGAWLLEVDDTLVALGDLCRAHRRQYDRPVVGITGSNGKTTIKELTALTLGAAGPVLATRANHNNRIGVPQTLARLRGGQRFAVVEMGTSELGEIAELARIAEPTVGVITNIAEAHLEGLGSVEAVAAEKGALLQSLSADATAIAPADEPLLSELLASLPCRVLTFGRGEGADVCLASDIAVQGFSQRFDVRVVDTIVEVQLPGLGVHLADNAMAALAVAYATGANLHAAARMLGSYEPVGQRMRPLQVGGLLVLEDCYNANPRSCEVAITTLTTLPGPRVAVFGDMLELGTSAAALHERVGVFAAKSEIDALVAIGVHAPDYVRGAREAGIKAAIAATDVADAAAHIRRFAGATATVLVKGSRGAKMERVIDALKASRLAKTALEVTRVSLAF